MKKRGFPSGTTYYLRNQPDEVVACATRATEYWQKSIPFNKATASQLRGHGHKLNKDYTAAITAYREVLETHRSIAPESRIVSIALNDLASAERASKDYVEAERDYRKALRIAKKVEHQELVAETTGNIARLSLDRKQWPEAESLAREALVLAEKIGSKELIANNCHSIAKALLKQNKNLKEAQSLIRRSVEIFTRLRYVDLPAAQQTLAEIENAMSGE